MNELNRGEVLVAVFVVVALTVYGCYALYIADKHDERVRLAQKCEACGRAILEGGCDEASQE